MGASQALKVVSEVPAVELGAERHIVHSHRIGREFQVTVSRPLATPFVPGQTFPVMFALDGGMGVAGPMATVLGYAGAMAPALVVSVGYQPEQQHHRMTDLAHNQTTGFDGVAFGGGGAAFQAFLLDDLQPFIESRYPADLTRTALFGHSLGGLFAANVMADRPGAFGAYVIGSPSIVADPGVVGRVEKAISKAKGGRVFLGVGSHEDAFFISRGQDAGMLTGFARLDAALRRQPRIASKTHIYPGEGHVSVYSRIIEDAFPFVFPPRRPLTAPHPKPRRGALRRYAGVYTLPDGRKATITLTPGDMLMARVADLPWVPLTHVGANRFHAPTSDLDVLFDNAGFTITGGGGATWRGVRD
ncbi:MAG: alpha/beta hydrolase [Caulobacterales bacterium]